MKLFVILLVGLIAMNSANGHTIQKKLENELAKYNAEVGVAFIAGGDTIVVNNGRYPMNSVMKLYQAVAVASQCDLDSMMFIKATELNLDTYSPMLKEYADKDFKISISNLLSYSLSESDNNACDILFNHTLNLNEVEKFVHELGIDSVSIRHDENSMHNNPSLSNENWNNPLAAAMLINRLFTGGIIVDRHVMGKLMFFMADNNQTGKNRLQKLLKDAKIAHKTGTGFNDADGHPQGINDVGFVMLPDGRHYSIAIFVKHTVYDLATTENIIARISAMVYDFVVKN